MSDGASYSESSTETWTGDDDELFLHLCMYLCIMFLYKYESCKYFFNVALRNVLTSVNCLIKALKVTTYFRRLTQQPV